MAMPLSTADLARIEQATRVLLSPLAVPSEVAWREEAIRAVGDALGAEAGAFYLSGRTSLHAVAQMEDSHRTALDDYVGPILEQHEDGPDPLLARAYRYVEQHRLTVGDDTLLDHILGGGGISTKTDFYHDVLVRYKTTDAHHLMWGVQAGMAHLSVSRFRRAPAPGEHLGLLRLLHPAFAAGLDTLERLHAHRAALDDLKEPLAIFDADGTETHRTPALARLLACDPEAARVLQALAATAQRARPLAFARRGERGDPDAPVADVRTAYATYALRAVLLGPCAFTYSDAFLISVAVRGAPAVLPSAADLRHQHGLSRREAEVALLVAQGYSNNQIADRLFVSRHTVRHHVEAAMAKLNLTGRGRETVAAALLEAGVS